MGSEASTRRLGGSDGKELACDAGDLGSVPGSGRLPGGRHANPLQYSCLENPMDRGAWRATVHGVAQLSMHAGVIEPNTPVLQTEKLRTRVLPPQVYDVLFFKSEKCGMGWVGRRLAVKQKGVKILHFFTLAKKSLLASEPHFPAFNTIVHHSWERISISVYGALWGSGS